MELQPCESRRARLVADFRQRFRRRPGLLKPRLKLSWSNWGFGCEPLEDSVRRLRRHGIEWIELHGNRYGRDLGYRAREVRAVLRRHGIRAAGVCGMFGAANDLSSNSGLARQQAVDYIRRQLDLCREVGGDYLLVVPGAVGRPQPYDQGEFERSAETLRLVADDFVQAGVRAAIEPIRSAEVSIVHTVADARRYLQAVGHPGIAHINGDVYHMQTEESWVPGAILAAGAQMINLHLADSNRGPLGDASLDLDAILMALYLVDYQHGRRFATPEPLGPGGDPYPAMHGRPDPELLDTLVARTAAHWRRREEQIRELVA